MSYVRFGKDSDVYVYHHYQGFLECCGCILDPEGEGWSFPSFKTRSEMITHLEEHKKAGHDVPEYAIDRLKEEIETIGDDVED